MKKSLELFTVKITVARIRLQKATGRILDIFELVLFEEPLKKDTIYGIRTELHSSVHFSQCK